MRRNHSPQVQNSTGKWQWLFQWISLATSSIPTPKFGSESILRQAFILSVLYLSLGVLIYWFNCHDFVGPKTHPVVDALYFCIVTMCMTGFGDITPNNTATKLFSILFVSVGFGFIDIWLSGMVGYVLDLKEEQFSMVVKGIYQHLI
ncbi:hypothetical protein V6N13_093860 [Hibiscus sabdariffa]